MFCTNQQWTADLHTCNIKYFSVFVVAFFVLFFFYVILYIYIVIFYIVYFHRDEQAQKLLGKMYKNLKIYIFYSQVQGCETINDPCVEKWKFGQKNLIFI